MECSVDYDGLPVDVFVSLEADRATTHMSKFHLDIASGVGLGELLGVHFSVLRAW